MNTQTNAGIGFVGLLTILFIGLKLTGYITWSWMCVLLLPMCMAGIVVIVVAVIAIIIILSSE